MAEPLRSRRQAPLATLPGQAALLLASAVLTQAGMPWEAAAGGEEGRGGSRLYRRSPGRGVLEREGPPNLGSTWGWRILTRSQEG